MGALTEYVDMIISKEAYRIASAITDNLIDYFELGAENVTEDEICSWIKEAYPDDGFMIRNADLIAGEAYAKLQHLRMIFCDASLFFLKCHSLNKKNF